MNQPVALQADEGDRKGGITILNSRRQRILQRLSREPDYIRIKELSKDLGLDPRWVRYDLEAVADWAERKGGRLIRQRGRRIHLEGVAPDSLSEAALKEEAGLPQVRYEYVLSIKERQQIILTRLLNQTGWIRTQELAAMLLVSRATIHKDLDELEPWLSDWRIHLERRANAGIALTGPEPAWRRVMCDVLYETSGTAGRHRGDPERSFGPCGCGSALRALGPGD